MRYKKKECGIESSGREYIPCTLYRATFSSPPPQHCSSFTGVTFLNSKGTGGQPKSWRILDRLLLHGKDNARAGELAPSMRDFYCIFLQSCRPISADCLLPCNHTMGGSCRLLIIYSQSRVMVTVKVRSEAQVSGQSSENLPTI